jgi:hypothetical protein
VGWRFGCDGSVVIETGDEGTEWEVDICQVMVYERQHQNVEQ